MKLQIVFAFLLVAISLVNLTSASDRRERLFRSERVVFLGDSITFAGGYVAMFDAWIQTQDLNTHPEIVNVGLPSETVSGLSEEGHAGGRFPRPDLAERLDRVLTLTKPDLVFACYGINCGIYQPLDEQRFRCYQAGIRQLKSKVEALGATLVLITPPHFDDQRAKKPFSYNGVLDHYSKWLLAQRDQGWLVVDLHGPMTDAVAAHRNADPDFTFQPDAVHPNSEGHWFMAQQLIRWFGDTQAADADTPEAMLASRGMSPEAMKLIHHRMTVLRNAYVATAGHKRPGVPTGLPLSEAKQKAEELSEQIQSQRQATKR